MFRILVIALLTIPNLGHAQIKELDPFLQDELYRWENARKYTLAVLHAMPEAQYTFKPTPEEMDFRNQAAHLADNILWLTSKFVSKETAPLSVNSFQGTTKAQLIDLVMQTFDYGAEGFRNLDPLRLAEEIDFAGQKMSRRRIIFLINDHLTHHRAQMIVYLRLQGITPPKYVGW
ncbi:DinB family protein [Dyadobacter tibetensis]|uniref:DinB family protein n=1 Tax=Dyadobacter tibetensis TaxID=1211851 RepID=UPI0004717DCD|nr:DinB family protein [Dyadobacter tibetensis]